MWKSGLLVDENETHSENIIDVKIYQSHKLSQGNRQIQKSKENANIGSFPSLLSRDCDPQSVKFAACQKYQA
jgi:hypothetical protein